MGSPDCQRCNGEMIDRTDPHWYKYVCHECFVDIESSRVDAAYDRWKEQHHENPK